MLLTLSNFKFLRASTVPQLVSQFETDFSVQLTEETKTIYDVLGQIDKRLFQSYTRSVTDRLSTIIRKGISSQAWVPKADRPTDVGAYVYEALLQLVYVHTEVSTTAASLTSQILSHLLEHISTSLHEALRLRSKYTLPALLQATLDVEFFTQALSQYITDRVSETQNQIYFELDKGADDNAKKHLESELPAVRAVLKRLKDDTKSEFACFKRQRSQHQKIEK